MKFIRFAFIVFFYLILLNSTAYAYTNPFTTNAVKINSKSSQTTGNITASALNIRTGPWGRIVGTYKKDDKVKLIAKKGDWYKVSYRSKTRYIHSAYVSTSSKKRSSRTTGYVNCHLLNVRKTPNGKILGQVKKSQKVQIIGSSGGWYKIKYGNRYAYVYKKYIDGYKPKTTKTTSSKSFTGYITASALNVRTGPMGKIVGTVRRGAAIKIIGKSGNWYKVIYKGKTRYVHSSYISNKKTSSSRSSSRRTSKSGSLQKRVSSCARALLGSKSFRTADVAYGRLACAKVITTALKNAGALSRVHLNVRSTVTDLKSKGWKQVRVPPFQEGDVITWKTYDYTGDGVKDPDTHVGIMVKSGNSYMAVNNSSSLKTPRLSRPYSVGPVSRVLRKA